MLQEELIQLTTKDQEEIALWKVYIQEKAKNKHIFLTHGTFSDKRICLGIAQFLAARGYTCWIMEWRNHGSSSPTNQKFNLETVALYDIAATFDYLFKQEGITSLSCVTHSGGGICLSMFLIKNKIYIPQINRVVLFACQAFAATHNFVNTSKIRLGKWISFLLGYLPAKRIGHPHNESHFMMKQWFNWNLSQNFLGKKGFDYQKEMPKINFPILSICGEGDKFIAPVQGCQKFLDAFQSPQNQLLYCGKSLGYLENYSHDRVVLSSTAKKEIWPKTLDWIES